MSDNSGRKEAGRTPQLGPLVLPDCGVYAFPNKIPHLDLNISPFHCPWRILVLTYGRVPLPSVENQVCLQA